MSTRSSSRIYTPRSLEAWFTYVAVDWESAFSSDSLKRGREIYRQGQISGLELTQAEAIVHCTYVRKDTCYAVIDWLKQQPIVRGSTGDQAEAEAVAVAGLYEIEELIADEIEPIAYQPAIKNQPDAAVAQGRASTLPEPVVDSVAARRLTPHLAGSTAGLSLTAYWTNADFSREAAFCRDAPLVSSLERELVVRLTGLAKGAGFKYRRDRNDFLLRDSERIAPFFSHARKRWEQVFDFIELDYEAQLMAKGVRKVKIFGRVEAVQADSMRVDWRFKLGHQWLDAEDAVRLAKAGRGTHFIKGLGLVGIAAEQTDALKEWRVSAANRDDAQAVWSRYMMFSLFGERGAQLDVKGELKHWRQGIVAADSGTGPELPAFLRNYQAQGVRWMANLRARGCHGLLADEMGLGKTLQVLTLLHFYPFESQDSLIVCPASVVPVWVGEVKRWYPELETVVLRADQHFDVTATAHPRLWIASYTQLRRHKHLLDSIEFGYAVLDEAQQIKNPDAKVTQACCAIQAVCRLALTGTPIENRLLDLWTLFRFLMPGLLGARRRFEEAAMSANRDLRLSFELRLRQQLTPFILRREKDKVGTDLPQKLEMDLICPISDLQRQTYDSLLARGREELGDDLESAMQTHTMHFFSLLTRLRQACCDPGLIPNVQADISQSGKIQMLLTRLSESLQGQGAQKVVIFSQFVQLLKRLKPAIKSRFPTVNLLELTGGTHDRAKPVEAFQNTAGPAIILVSLRAGGTGITLHAADYVFLMDPWWNPAVEDQAVDRVHRIGQDRRVFVYRMITQGTIEERIQHLKREKRELFQDTLGHLGSAKDLKDHFGDLQQLARLLPSEPGLD